MDEQNAAKLHAELEHRERQIAAIRHVSDTLFSHLASDDLMRETLKVAIEVLGADAGSLQIHDPAHNALVFRYVALEADAALVGHATPITQGISGRVFRTGISDLAEDVSRSVDFNPAIDTKTGYHTRSALTVPLKRTSGTPIGVMQVLNLREPFNQRDLEVLEVLAAQAATSIENARMVELARKAEVVDVIGNIAHDIYNMLTPLESGLLMLQPMLDRLYERLDTLRERCPDLAWREELAGAAGEAVDYDWILDQALSANKRVQARTHWLAGAVKGKLPSPVFEKVDLNETVREAAASLLAVARRGSIDLRMDLDAALPPIKVDPEHIYNAIYNLVNNAIPYTSPGGSIILRTRFLKPEGDDPGSEMILIEVIDTGRGMDQEVRDKLFTDATISTTPGGTGLGTRIVKHVVDQHHGSIEVQSEVGQGSTFSIRLPLSQSDR